MNFEVVLAPLGLLAALGAAWFAIRKRALLASAVGLIASLAALWVAASSLPASDDAFPDFAAAAVLVFLVVPLTVTAILLARSAGRRQRAPKL